MLELFIKGIVIGFSIAAAVGPIGLLCIQRSLSDGFKIGFASGLGAATADGLYGLVAGFGLTAVSTALVAWQFWIRLLGGAFLVYLGVSLMRAKPKDKAVSVRHQRSLVRAYIETFFLTLTNPMTILSFVAIFAGVGVGVSGTDYASASLFVAGVALGSALWWLILSGVVAFVLRHRLSVAVIHRINMFSGFVMLAFAAIALWACVGKVAELIP